MQREKIKKGRTITGTTCRSNSRRINMLLFFLLLFYYFKRELCVVGVWKEKEEGAAGCEWGWEGTRRKLKTFGAREERLTCERKCSHLLSKQEEVRKGVQSRIVKDKEQRALLSWTLLSLIIISRLFLRWSVPRRGNRLQRTQRWRRGKSWGNSCWHRLKCCMERLSVTGHLK